jgi:hypothetical protein
MTRWQYLQLLVAINEAKKAEAAAAVTPAPPPVPPPDVVFPRFVVYVVRGSDRAAQPGLPDLIRTWLATADVWFAGQTGGRRPRYERSGGSVVVREVQLDVTTAVIEGWIDGSGASNPFAKLYAELAVERGIPSGPDAALVFADVVPPADPGFALCGEAVLGFAAIYTPNNFAPGTFAPCDAPGADPFLSGAPFVIAHEMLHAFGAAPRCAPHDDGGGHVTDAPNDILDASPDRTQQVVLDVNRDDYYLHGIAGCPDVAASPWWE